MADQSRAPQLVAPRQLTSDELENLRSEYLSIEEGIHRYITIYLTAIAVVTGWILGPESVGPRDLFTGNKGYNLYIILVLAILNTTFLSFLLYQALQIHELMQFATKLSPLGGYLEQWEAWRRSEYSVATGAVRTIRHMLVAVVPILVTGVLLTFAGVAIFSPATITRLPGNSPGIEYDWRTTAVWILVTTLCIVVTGLFVLRSIVTSQKKWKLILAERPRIDFTREAEPAPKAPRE